jgi:hypothetical protein
MEAVHMPGPVFLRTGVPTEVMLVMRLLPVGAGPSGALDSESLRDTHDNVGSNGVARGDRD